MPPQELAPLQQRRLSLSALISFGLVIAAILPLFLALGFSEWQARPALISQAKEAMESDAKARVQLIDTYFQERILDSQTLAQVPSVQTFLLARPGAPDYQVMAQHALYALGAGMFRDKHYSTWALFDTQGTLRLYYPSQPTGHGQSMIPPELLAAVNAGKTFISPVYYTKESQKASVDIYTPIPIPQATDGQQPGTTTGVQGNPNPAPKGFVGLLRSTLQLDYIWNIVQNELGNNGKGSYAFILDENGVRVADTDPSRLFKSVSKLPNEVQLRIQQEVRYGDSTPVAVLSDSYLAHNLRPSTNLTTFQEQPAGQKEIYQGVQHLCTNVPWSYIVLSPDSTVTAVANRQLLTNVIIAAAMALLVAVIGLIVGQRLTRPILGSVKSLLGSSQSLSELATRQQDAASEQMWVVDSSQVGLQSVQYYTQATRVAAHTLKELGIQLLQQGHRLNTQQIRQWLEQMIATAQYIEDASEYQKDSNQKLATALKVATQVSEQLAAGATSATEAAAQLETVVTQLRAVVGR